ncbi:hypothetical protein BOW53_01275 [Solemya pervernicosa gill symbiont]|uniref:Cofactor-independent phosphoglycerate mutase n=1 Tax=Solemya pervernicosa gill symbiont TaxID=642797 RepID=A0A1T2LA64_9GAMM|nr:hypothetical protein BOW53_01275 [Solemya pervernicosa gill symbiont]
MCTNHHDATHNLFACFTPSRNITPPFSVAQAAYVADVSSPSDNEVGYLLRADPVHLRPEITGLHLYEMQLLNIEREEAEALIESINELITPTGMSLEMGTEGRWYLKLAEDPKLNCMALEEAIGCDVSQHLPKGEGGAQWNQWLNEIQMLLHTHPVNQQRQLTGRAEINSLWLWGGGQLPELSSHFDEVWSNSVVAEGLARLSATAHHDLPQRGDNWLDGVDTSSSKILLVIEGLESALAYGDFESWYSQLQILDRNWFAALQSLLESGAVESIQLLPCSGSEYRITRSDRWKLWRRKKPIVDLINYLRD